jgi:Domain of Unknown Function (DUF1080)
MKRVLKCWMQPLLLALLLSMNLSAEGKPNALSPQEVADGWVLLWDGATTFGWESHGKAEWKIADEDGVVTAFSGDNGWLGTTTVFADFILKVDFVLQLDVRTNPKDDKHHPNSGVFFRGEPGKFWTGYESQIRNEYKENDRSQAVDFGTGGIYHFQPARRVIPNDGSFFAKTIVAHGRHIATWVNGIQVSDYADTRSEGTDVLKEAQLTAGPIGLQAHDPTTNLDFRNLRIAVLPKQ